MSSDTAQSPDPGALVKLSTDYWGSQALFTANRLGVFDALVAGARSAERLAQELALDCRTTGLLLRACVALDLLGEEDAGVFSLTSLARAFLVQGSPAYLGDALRYGDDMYGVWGRLGETVRTGEPALPTEDYLGRDPDRTRHFVHGMHDRALSVGRGLIGLVSLDGCRRLLDVGGGPGTYSALLAAGHPQLECLVLELPAIAEIAREILADMPGGSRVRVIGGDYHQTVFPGENDVVLMSGIFHREDPATCRGLILRAVDVLEPGGQLLVSDVFTDPGGASPFASLFGLNMALSAPNGGVHSTGAVCDWMEEAGIADISVQPFPMGMPHRLVRGVKS